MISATIQIDTQFYDLDPMGVVWHGNYARFLEQARCALLDKIGYNYSAMGASGYAWPIVDMQTKFIKPIGFPQKISVEAVLQEYENRLKISYLITDEQGAVLTKAVTTQVAVDIESKEMQFESPAVFMNIVKEML